MASTGRTFERVVEIARGLMEAEGAQPVARVGSPRDVREVIELKLGERGLGADDVMELLERVVMATPRTGSRRFFNQLFAGRDEVAVAAEMLTAVLNSSMYTFKVAGPHVMIETEVTRHMAGLVGYEDGEGVFVPGGSMSNLAAMIMARNEAEDGESGVRQRGMSGARMTIYASEDCHYSVPKGAGMAGIGRENVRAVAVDDRGRMDPRALREMIAADRAAGATPIMICATSGTTVLAAFDPIEPIADVAKEFGLWLHVDGALGGSVAVSARHRGLIAGSERSDSFTWDAHKLMGTPLSCSVILCRRSGMLRKHFEEGASYLFQTCEDDFDHGKRSMQCGRRNDALKLWAAWKAHGDAGYGARIDHLFEMASYAAELVEGRPELRLVKKPESMTVCFEVLGGAAEAGEEVVSSQAVCERLQEQGRAMVGYADVEGRRVVRLAVANVAVRKEDLEGFVEDVVRVGGEIAAEGRGRPRGRGLGGAGEGVSDGVGQSEMPPR